MENTNTNALATAIQTQNDAPVSYRPGDIFMNIRAFEDAQRMVNPLSKSDLVPTTFQGKIGNCLIALETAQRIGASPMMVMQNLYIVHGKPAWSSQFLIACVNASGKFSPLRYKMTGEKGTDTYGCIAWAKDKNDGEVLESPEITIGIAKKDGWFGKSGSKWQTMPELMLRYRCATLFARLFAPELTMGIQTAEEVIDVQPIVTESRSKKLETIMNDAKVDYAQEVKQVSESDKIKDAIDKISGYPCSAEDVKKYVEEQGEMLIADMIIPQLNAIADKILSK